ncbi:glycosyltransferase involved in cell wall biosynthesis [Bradyrhizobium sp. LM2.7]
MSIDGVEDNQRGDFRWRSSAWPSRRRSKREVANRVSMGVLIPLPLNGMGVGYTCGSLVEGMADHDLEMTVVTPRNSSSLPSVEVIETLPKWARYMPYRWLRPYAGRKIEADFLCCFDGLRSQRLAAYLWPGASLETIRELKRREVTIFREQFNCHTATAKRILDNAYERLGIMPAHTITGEMIEAERRALEAVDYVFCPSPLVETSLLENGVPSRRLLRATYGWDPDRLSGSHRRLARAKGITAVFVGRICVRKGAHLLLEYWVRSGIEGRLVLAGEMEPIIEKRYAHLLSRDDVVVLDYFRDVGALYRSADIFLFPTLEEGSPLVIYEACGSGLPIVTTGMGAGTIVRNGCEGFVIDPYDAAGWGTAIQSLAEDVELRRRMSLAAEERAKAYIWTLVADHRRRQILNVLGSVPHD